MCIEWVLEWKPANLCAITDIRRQIGAQRPLDTLFKTWIYSFGLFMHIKYYIFTCSCTGYLYLCPHGLPVPMPDPPETRQTCSWEKSPVTGLFFSWSGSLGAFEHRNPFSFRGWCTPPTWVPAYFASNYCSARLEIAKHTVYTLFWPRQNIVASLARSIRARLPCVWDH
jgi:hypothetical protein